jgi:hypothetical protein
MSMTIVARHLVLVLGKVSVDVASEMLMSLVGKYVDFGIMNMKNSIKSYMSVAGSYMCAWSRSFISGCNR